LTASVALFLAFAALAAWQWDEYDRQTSFGPGKKVAAILVADRSRADAACRRAAWARGSIVVVGWLVLVCVALTWRATVRLTEARGRARTLEAQARHFRDLSQALFNLLQNPVQAAPEKATLETSAVCGRDGRLTTRDRPFMLGAAPVEEPLQQVDDPAVRVDRSPVDDLPCARDICSNAPFRRLAGSPAGRADIGAPGAIR
jgi:hypothetical protein